MEHFYCYCVLKVCSATRCEVDRASHNIVVHLTLRAAQHVQHTVVERRADMPGAALTC